MFNRCAHQQYSREERKGGPVDVCQQCGWERAVIRLPSDSGPSPRTYESRGEWSAPRRG